MAGTIVASTLSDGTTTSSVTDAVKGSARAWVNFNGVTTATIRASYNVSSVTRNGIGDYTINFTNTLADANYSVNVSAIYGTNGTNIIFPTLSTTGMLNTGCRVINIPSGGGTGGNLDASVYCATFFR